MTCADGERAPPPRARTLNGERPRLGGQRPLAAFLAHLIATDRQAPQTRPRRRASAQEAGAAYGTAAAASAAGRVLSRSA
jgi:hypothetical protein